MKHLITLSLSVVLLATVELVFAAEQTITKTITLELGNTIPTINAVVNTSAEEKVLSLNEDRTVENGFLGNIGFGATGATGCEMTITSEDVNESGGFLLVKSPGEISESILYELSSQNLKIIGKLDERFVNGSPFSTTSGEVQHTITNSGWSATAATAESDYVNADSPNSSYGTIAKFECSIHLINLKATNFRTNIGALSNIPVGWKGDRTGNLVFTMTVD